MKKDETENYNIQTTVFNYSKEEERKKILLHIKRSHLKVESLH